MHFGQFSKSIRNGFSLNTKYSENLFSEYFFIHFTLVYFVIVYLKY